MIKIEFVPQIKQTDTIKHTKIAIIIPYRDRKEHFKLFLEHLNKLDKHQNKIDVYVIEQSPNEKFNRGLLLNVGFHILDKSNKKYDKYIFHDVDSLPNQELFNQYFMFVRKNVHYASPYLGYKYNYPGFVGGVISLTKSTYKKINGFPNNFYGWGGEDDALGQRIRRNDITLYRPRFGSYYLIDHEPPVDEQFNFKKKENRLYDNAHWKTNGLNQIDPMIKNHNITIIQLQDNLHKLYGNHIKLDKNIHVYFFECDIIMQTT